MTISVAILGPGALGLSLARHAAQRGLEVRLVGRGLEHAHRRLLKAQERWGQASAPDGSSHPHPWMERIRPCSHVDEALSGCQILLEALPEDLSLKATAWKRLDTLAPPEVLRLTGTSSLSIRTIREAAGMEQWLLGFHLFIPVHRMRVVELAIQAGTPDHLLDRATSLAHTLDLQAVSVHDQPGLAAARMALIQGLEAMRLLEQGAATAADLDSLMVRGYGHPVGPLELSDRIGLDLRLAIAEQLHHATGNPCFEAPGNLRALVHQGNLGRKTGQGFFHWDAEGNRR